MLEIMSCKKNDESYPKRLREVKAAPEILYYSGDISICESIVIAVIGRRDAQQFYLRIARYMGKVLASHGYTVLNGLAIGVDTNALEGALEQKGKVVAVMPGGLDEIYPRSNSDLAERIVKMGGCLISEYPSGTRPRKYTFVQRDRIQAMLSDKVIIVDAAKDGGTMYTAECAKKYERPIGCYMKTEKGDISEGNRLLVDSRLAKAVNNEDELIKFVGMPEYLQMSMFD